jgi:DnaJ-class molecular chaperone|tara:strand:+ start:201 stop:659 length:459 start_codon:yes stop_codon:yes gene_type:complete
MNNPYKTLNVSPASSLEEITQAFRKMALKYHPDRNKSPDADTRFKEAYEAYRFLKDAAAKAEYNTQKYESQRFRARTKTKEDLEASSLDGYEKAFATDPTIVNNLYETLENMKNDIKNSKRDLDTEFQDYRTKAEAKKQWLREEMRKMYENV